MNLAGTVIKDKENRILLIHRNTEKLKQWELPGGKVEEGECYEETAIRELQEELNIKVRIIKSLGNKIFYENGKEMNYYWYQAEIIQGEPKIMESKFDDLKYFSKEDMDKIQEELSSNMKNLIQTI